MLTPITTTKSGYISSATAKKKKKTLLVSKKELIFRILKSIITSGHQGRLSEQVHSEQNSENSRKYKGPDKEEIHHTHALAMNIALMVCICFKISKDVHFSVCQ